MTSKALPQYQEIWGLTDEVHEAVLRELEDRYDGADLVQLDRAFRELPVEMYEGPEVEVDTYMEALQSLDGRTWHDRGVDALVQFHSQTFEQSEFDMMLREQDYHHTPANSDDPDIHRGLVEAEDVRVPKSDIDFARISFRPDELFIELWEVKTAWEQDASEQIDTHIEALRNFEDATGIDVNIRDRELYASDVKDRMNATEDNYAIPRKYWGNSEIMSGAESTEIFPQFQDDFIGADILSEASIKEVKTQDEFL